MTERVWIIDAAGDMRPGFYRTRLVKNGPLVAVTLAEIAPPFDEDFEPMWDYVYRLTIDGEDRDPFTTSPLAGEPVTEAEVDYIDAVRIHDRTHGTPLADARLAIDPLQSPLPF